MKFRIKDMDISTGGPLIVVMNSEDAKKQDFHIGDRVGLHIGKKKAVAILNFAESRKAMPFGMIGCYDEVIKKLGARNGQPVSISQERKPESVTFIKKKLNGEKLSYSELRAIVQDIVDNKLSDVELSYFVAACHTNIMTMQETIDLTKAMISTGEILKFQKKPVMDKHCVGGVAGNRTTLVVVPILAAAGLTVPKTSSRSITSPAGTADTMEVLAPVSFSMKKVKDVVKKHGACMVWGGAINLAPADDRIIRVEHPLSIDSRSQLLASILAKKASVSSTHVLVDIPIGKGAKIENLEKAIELKKQFEHVGKAVGMKIKAIITDGSQPIGNGMGPSLEARDVLWVLRNDPKAPHDLRKKSLMIAGMMLEMSGKAAKGKGNEKAAEILETGKAYRKFLNIAIAQGGREILPELIPMARFHFDVHSAKSGKITHIDNEQIAKIARTAGAPQDKASGIYLEHHKGEEARAGELLYTIFSNSRDRLQYAVEIAKKDNGFVVK